MATSHERIRAQMIFIPERMLIALQPTQFMIASAFVWTALHLNGTASNVIAAPISKFAAASSATFAPTKS